MNILQINGSARSQGAHSTQIADKIVAQLRAKHPEAVVTRHDLASAPHPALDQAALDALFTPAESRTPEQVARVALDDARIAEVQAADVIVLGVPMYNFGISSQLKNWIDAIARAGVTFRYTDTGPEGLLTGKRLYAACARGGRYRGTAADTQTPYLETYFRFLGITDLHFAYAEGMNLGDAAVEQGLAEAEADIAAMPF
ncbi:FMN-dependent NADH-azoreductase [Thiohalocapsa marina]|uniref:FMN dependent NADH:quinone oxidoreductase n=1 Tax=Thiohalocapsa marina TaxID=424902 RepID=A0A5M8FKM2_9GAMM|nr:NAD(P)H-dependent oxidoreductase [Thiohalocapsa marina]KAA6184530.1 FMN-dependent NADH-azoreductase [Thiohalocapsa marina]